MKLKNSTYDKLKTVALIVAPLLTFAAAVCVIWGVPYSEQITATIAALDTFLGTLLTNSTDAYRAETEQMNYNTDDNEGYEVIEYEDQEIDTEE